MFFFTLSVSSNEDFVSHNIWLKKAPCQRSNLVEIQIQHDIYDGYSLNVRWITFREWLSLYSDTYGTYSSVCVHLYVSIKTEIFLKPFDQILKSRIHFYLHAPFLKYSGLPFLWFWFPRFHLPLVSRNLTISTSFTSLLSSHRHCIISRLLKKKGTVW